MFIATRYKTFLEPLCKIHFTDKDFAARYNEYGVTSKEEKGVISEILLSILQEENIDIYKTEANSEWTLPSGYHLKALDLEDVLTTSNKPHTISNTEYKYIVINKQYMFFFIEKEMKISQNAINFIHFMFRYEKDFGWILKIYKTLFSSIVFIISDLVSNIYTENKVNFSRCISFVIFKGILRNLYKNYKDYKEISRLDKLIKENLEHAEHSLYKSIYSSSIQYQVLNLVYKNIVKEHSYIYDEIHRCFKANDFWKDAESVVTAIIRSTSEAIQKYASKNAVVLKKQTIVDDFTRFLVTKSTDPLVIGLVAVHQRGNIMNYKTIKYFTKLFFTVSNKSSVINSLLLITFRELSSIKPFTYLEYQNNYINIDEFEEYYKLTIQIDYQIKCNENKINAVLKKIEFGFKLKEGKDEKEKKIEKTKISINVKLQNLSYISKSIILHKILTKYIKSLINLYDLLLNLITSENIELIVPTLIQVKHNI